MVPWVHHCAMILFWTKHLAKYKTLSDIYTFTYGHAANVSNGLLTQSISISGTASMEST